MNFAEIEARIALYMELHPVMFTLFVHEADMLPAKAVAASTDMEAIRAAARLIAQPGQVVTIEGMHERWRAQRNVIVHPSPGITSFRVLAACSSVKSSLLF